MKQLLLTSLALMLAVGAGAQSGSPSAQSIRVAPRPDNDLNVRIWTPEREYRTGENITIYYRANRDAYVLIFSTDADGETRQLLPNAYDSNNYVQGGRTYSIPNQGYRLEVTPPTGRETLSIVAFNQYYRTMDQYRARKAEAFPRSQGAEAAIASIVPRPDRDDGRTFDQDSTTIRVRSGWGDRDDRWDGRDGRWDNDRRDNRWDDYYDRWGGYYDRWNNNDPDVGRLHIDSEPGGSYVYVNGQFRGVTPMNLGRIRAGNYEIVVTRAGYRNFRETVRVEEGEQEQVDANLDLIYY